MRPNDAELRQMYEVDRLSLRQIAKRSDCATTTVRLWLMAAGVKLRSISEAKKGQKPAPQAVLASVNARRKHTLPGRGAKGYKVNGYGYVMVWNAEQQAYAYEHRLVMEQSLGRKLNPSEDVHHKNGIKTDNRVENLEIISRADHLREHYSERQIDSATGRFLPVKQAL